MTSKASRHGPIQVPIHKQTMDVAGLPLNKEGVWSHVAYFEPSKEAHDGTRGQAFDFENPMQVSLQECLAGIEGKDYEYELIDEPQQPKIRFTLRETYVDLRWRLVGGCHANDIKEDRFRFMDKNRWSSVTKFPDTGEPPPYWTLSPLDGKLHAGNRYER